MKDESINNEQLVRLAFSKQIKVHLILKNGTWRNGFVTKLDVDFFYFKDTENAEEPFFYIQVVDVQPFTKPKGVDKNG